MSSSNPSKLKSDSDNGRDQGTADHRDPAQNEICGRPPNRDEIPKIPSTLRAYYQPILGDLNQEPSHQQLIALTSCKPGEGVSTVATQLAICAAQQGTQVLLIDCNENNPCLHRTFGVKSAKGFRDFLKNGNTLDTIHTTSINNLSIMPFGRGRIMPLPIQDFEDAIDQVMSEFDLLILDLPAISNGRHTTRWAASLEYMLLIVGNSTSPMMAGKYKQRLENAGANLCGIIRNLK